MAYVPQIALAASLGKRIVVCGDFYSYLQLRWQIMNSFANGLGKIYFTMLGLLSLLINQKHTQTYLCCRNKDVCMRIYRSLRIRLFIKIEYTHHPSVSERKELAKLQPFANEASVLFDTSQMGAFR